MSFVRRFLADGAAFPKNAQPVRRRWGYLSPVDDESGNRVRLTEWEGLSPSGEWERNRIDELRIAFGREEFNVKLTSQEAERLWRWCTERLDRVRHLVEFQGRDWFVDVYGDKNENLVLAETTLEDENEAYLPPSWLGAEVTGIYTDSRLALGHLPVVLDTWGTLGKDLRTGGNWVLSRKIAERLLDDDFLDHDGHDGPFRKAELPMAETWDTLGEDLRAAKDWALKAETALLSPADARDILALGGRQLPWSPEEIPEGAIVLVHGGEMSLITIPEED